MAGETPTPPEVVPPKTPQEQWVEDSDLLDEGFDPDLDLPQTAPARTPAAAGSEHQQRPESKPKHSKRLIRMALDLGMTQAEIDAATPEDLDEDVYVLHRQALAAAAESRRMSQPTPQPASTPAAPVVDEVEAAFDRLAEAGLDPDLVAIVRRQQKELKELRELKGEVGTIRQREAHRETASAANVLDEAFDGLGEVYERVVGKGAASDMNDQDAHQRRISIIMAAGFKDMADVAAQSRAQVRSRIAAAAKKLFGGFLTEPEEEEEVPIPVKKTNGRLTAEQWAAAGVARPTHRHTTEPKGDRRATKAVARLQREQAGLNGDVPDGTEEASLPE